MGSPSTAGSNPINHLNKSKNSTFSTNVFLSGASNGWRIARVSSAALSFSARLLVWRLRPRPLLGGGSKVGSRMTGVTTWRVPHRLLGGGRQSTTVPTVTCRNGEKNHTSTHAGFKMSLKRAICASFYCGILSPSVVSGTCSSPSAGGRKVFLFSFILGPPSNQMSPYLG